MLEFESQYSFPEYHYPTQPKGTVGPAYGASPAIHSPETMNLDPYGNLIDPFTGELGLAKAGASSLMLLPAAAGAAAKTSSSWLPAATSVLRRIFPWLLGAWGGMEIAENLGAFDGNGAPSASRAIQAVGQLGPYGGVMGTPPSQLVAKTWNGIGGSRFYLLVNGRVVVRKANGVIKLVKRPRMIHMKASNPRLGDVAKAARTIKRTKKALDKVKF